MNKSIFLLLLLIMSSLKIYSQNEIKRDSSTIHLEIGKDSLVIRLVPLKEISKDPIIYQESFSNSISIELDRNESYDKTESELPNYLNYKLKLTPDFKSERLFSELSYLLNEYNYNYGIGNYRQGGVKLIYKPLPVVHLELKRRSFSLSNK